MARIVLIGVALIAFCLLPALQASAQQPAEQAPMVPAKDSPSYQLALKQAEANAQLDSLAKGLAGLLSEPGFRGHVRSTIAQSKNSENIVELEDFLAKAVQKTDLPPGVKKLNDTVLKAKTRTRDLKVWNKEGFDLYFPVKDHLNKWKGDTDFYVAYTPYNNSRDVGEIYGYSVKTGERYAFSVAAAPDVPVLIVAPCEHETHEVTEGPGPEKTPPPGVSATIKPDNKPRKVESDKGGNSYLLIQYIDFCNANMQDYETWNMGAPEFYLWYADVNMDTHAEDKRLSWSKLVSGLSPITQNDPVRLASSINVLCVWFKLPPYRHDLLNSCTDISFVEVWERDGGPMAATEGGGTAVLWDLLGFQYFRNGTWYAKNAACPYYLYDVRVDLICINKSDIPYQTDWQINGYADNVYLVVRKNP
jgi:hypothetical protein